VAVRNVFTIRKIGAIGLILCTAGVAACGSDDPDEPVPPETEVLADAPAPATPEPALGGASIVGSGNVGGNVIDPQPWPIDGIAIAESFPEQLIVSFTAGDPECTAAAATATSTADAVVVALEVGITEDALARSCRADDFEQTVSIALDEGLSGRDVVASGG
jgi:hypothetical protein